MIANSCASTPPALRGNFSHVNGCGWDCVPHVISLDLIDGSEFRTIAAGCALAARRDTAARAAGAAAASARAPVHSQWHDVSGAGAAAPRAVRERRRAQIRAGRQAAEIG